MVVLIYQRVSLPIKNGMLGYPRALCTLWGLPVYPSNILMSWDRIWEIIRDFMDFHGYFSHSIEIFCDILLGWAEIIIWNIPSHVHKITPETMVRIGNDITDNTIMRVFTMNGGNGGGGIEEDQGFKPNSWGLSMTFLQMFDKNCE